KSLLTWEARYKIVQDLTSALLYPYEEGDYCVLLRDIKTNNIMLDSSFDDKLGDYGLARLVDHSKGLKNTLLAGVGHIALECLSSGKASEESDVYSFGVVALEIACGKRSIEPKFHELDALLLPWVWESYGNGKVLDVADKKMGMEFDPKQMECLAPLPNLPSTILVPCYNAPIAPGIGTSEPVFVGITEMCKCIQSQ
ncbi:hypothetical protein Goarm_005448, partial [Gossypium armourianum]|nr:hypothetical protein [Gossypium armourianum]